MFVAGHKEVIKSDAGVTPDCVLDCGPVAVALLVGHAEEYDVGFLAEVLGLLGKVNYHFFDGAFIGIDFLLDEGRGLFLEAVYAFCALKVAFDLFEVVKRVHLFEKHLQVALHFFHRLRAHMLRYLRGHFPRVNLKRLNQLLEVAPVPV